MQQYTQPISYGITSYELKQWMSVAFVQDSFRVSDQFTLDAGLRYDRQTLTDATNNFAPRLGFALASRRRRAPGRFAAATRCTTRRSAPTRSPSALTGGLDGIVDLHGDARADRLPDLPDRPCLPVPFDPRTLPLSQQPARNITIRAGQRDFYQAQFASYGLNFDLLPNYPDEFVNPRSQVTSIGAEREIMHGPVRRRRLRAPALDRPRSQRRPERADAVRSHGDRADAERRRGERDASDRAGQRRRAQRQRADEPRRRRLRRAADAGQLSRQPRRC